MDFGGEICIQFQRILPFWGIQPVHGEIHGKSMGNPPSPDDFPLIFHCRKVPGTSLCSCATARLMFLFCNDSECGNIQKITEWMLFSLWKSIQKLELCTRFNLCTHVIRLRVYIFTYTYWPWQKPFYPLVRIKIGRKWMSIPTFIWEDQRIDESPYRFN